MSGWDWLFGKTEPKITPSDPISRKKADMLARTMGYRAIPGRSGAIPTTYGQKVVDQCKKEVTEWKYFDSEYELQNVTDGNGTWLGMNRDPGNSATPVSTMNTLFAPKRGTNKINERSGDTCTVHKIYINGSLRVLAQTVTAAPPLPDGGIYCRLILFQDKMSVKVQSNCATLMSDATANNDVLTFRNVDYLPQFEILKDYKYCLYGPRMGYANTANTIYAQGIGICFKIIKKFKNPITVRLSANNGTKADIIDNQFHLAANQDMADATEGTLPLQLTYFCRVSFKG